MTKEELLILDADVTWLWNDKFLLETIKGNFVWSSPEHPDGTNIIYEYGWGLKDYLKEIKITHGRDKGRHFINNYCGTEFKFTH